MTKPILDVMKHARKQEIQKAEAGAEWTPEIGQRVCPAIPLFTLPLTRPRHRQGRVRDLAHDDLP
ncbi:hypothetical protein E4N62_02990 [Streptomyces sp. MNU76]|uniref:hypothetical protein n=1 Tax=Streptomyces sp. MNU76 TaxID=2560026 RepID=UPI001E54FC21|nr:hypothetical protein [Streptomyces sp. MNU76]MCC9704324.1 hypothetical protein [Streptomyces sp. MNU76]